MDATLSNVVSMINIMRVQPQRGRFIVRFRGLGSAAVLTALSALLVSLFAQAALAQEAKRATVSAALNVSALRPGGEAVVAVVVDVAKGFHAQSHKPKDDLAIPLTIKLDKSDDVPAGEPIFPPGIDEDYPGVGTLSVYSGRTIVFVPYTVKADAKAGDATLSGVVTLQICNDKGECFAPEKLTWSASAKIVAKDDAVSPANAELFKGYQKSATAPVTKPTTAPAKGSAKNSGAPPVTGVESDAPTYSVLTAFGIAFVAGIFFNIVPCVLPVLPIKVLGFAQVAQNNRGKTVLLATVFGLGVVSVFTVLAVFILVLHQIKWGEQFSNPFFLWGVVIVLLLLSFWMFGILNINLPMGAYAFTPNHETFFGNYLWGILTAILSTPCTGPLFPPLMGWAAAQPQAIGVAAMMMVGVGMAFPYVFLSFFPELARKFPRVGPWAELFKQMMGFFLLGFTVYFAAGRFVTGAGQWWAAVPVAAMASFYLLARTVQLSKEARAVAVSGVLAVLILTTSVLVACKFSGVFDDHSASAGGSGAVGANWIPYSDSEFDAARKANKIVLVKFTASWCLTCQYIEATVFHDNAALAALRKYDVVTFKADLTKDDAPGNARLHELSATGGIPLTAIYAPGYDQPVKLSAVYTTPTLVSALDQLGRAKTAAAQ